MRNKKVLIYSALLVFGSCAPALYKPLPEHVSNDVTLEQLVEGRKSYVNKCGSCHSLYLPQHYEAHVWKENVDEMQERSNIDDAEKKLILLYLNNYPKPG